MKEHKRDLNLQDGSVLVTSRLSQIFGFMRLKLLMLQKPAIYNIEIENTYTLNSDNLQFSIFNYALEDDFKKDSILEINARLLYDYNSYNNIVKLIHNYKLYDSENVLLHELKSLKSNAGDNLKDDLSQIDLFYVKLNKDHDRIKIELILSMIEGVTESVICKLYNSFNSNLLCIKYIKKN